MILLLDPDRAFLQRPHVLAEYPELDAAGPQTWPSQEQEVVFSSAKRDVTKRAFILPPELVTMMMSPLPSLAGARAMIFLSVFHSEISRASQPLMKTPTRSWANQR